MTTGLSGKGVTVKKYGILGRLSSALEEGDSGERGGVERWPIVADACALDDLCFWEGQSENVIAAFSLGWLPRSEASHFPSIS